MDGRHPTDNRIVFNNDMTCQHRIVSHDHSIAYLTIMSNMAVSHDQTMIADPYDRTFITRSVDGDELTDFTIFTDDNVGLFAFKLKILRFCANACRGPNHSTFSYDRVSIDISV